MLRLGIAAILCTLLLAACGDGGTTTSATTKAEPPVTVRDGSAAARLILADQEVSAGTTVTYGIENLGEVPLTFGVCGELEIREGNAWAPVASDMPCIEIAQILKPGESDPRCCTFGVPSGNDAAEYRLTHPVTDPMGTGLELRAGVTVTG